MTCIRPRRTLTALSLVLAAGPAAAIPLLPGDTIGSVDYDSYFDAAVTVGDPAWFGTVLATASGSAEIVRDGFDGFEEVEDLNAAGGRIDSGVSSVPGGLVFAYDFIDTPPLSFEPSSTVRATITGFSGYAVDLAPVANPIGIYAPNITRSADGDEILFDFAVSFDGTSEATSGLQGFGIEQILLRTDAPSYRLGDASLGLGLQTFGVTDTAVTPGALVPAAVPLPAGLPLLLGGLGALGLAARRRKG